MWYFLTVFFHFMYSFGSSSLEHVVAFCSFLPDIFLNGSIIWRKDYGFQKHANLGPNSSTTFQLCDWAICSTSLKPICQIKILILPSGLFCQLNGLYQQTMGTQEIQSFCLHSPGIIAFLTPASNCKVNPSASLPTFTGSLK